MCVCPLNTDVFRLLCTNTGSANHPRHACHHLDITQPWRHSRTAVSLIQPSASGSHPQERLPSPRERNTPAHKPAFSTIFPVCHVERLRGRSQAPQQNEITPEGSVVKSARRASHWRDHPGTRDRMRNRDVAAWIESGELGPFRKQQFDIAAAWKRAGDRNVGHVAVIRNPAALPTAAQT